MRDYSLETEGRIACIREILARAGATGIVFGNSGGKDSALAGILCKMACEDTVGLVMPCGSKQNYQSDRRDALLLANKFDIETREIDLAPVQASLIDALGLQLSDVAKANIAPRLRMTTLYATAANEKRLVAGTGNRSEDYLGYFTKWGDGASDFEVISDLTVTEIYQFLEFLGAPQEIIQKDPSAGLFEGQTDETELGISYKAVDRFLLTGEANPADRNLIRKYHNGSKHKRDATPRFNEL